MTSNEEDKDPDIELFVKVSMKISFNKLYLISSQRSGINGSTTFVNLF